MAFTVDTSQYRHSVELQRTYAGTQTNNSTETVRQLRIVYQTPLDDLTADNSAVQDEGQRGCRLGPNYFHLPRLHYGTLPDIIHR